MRRVVATIMFSAVLAAACGQKAHVHVATGAGGAVADESVGGGDTGVGATDSGGATAGAQTATGGATAGGATTGGATAGGATGAAGGVTRTTVRAGTNAPRTGGISADATGVSDTQITIGIHAPVTGAAPFPNQSFQNGKDLYFKWLNDNGKLNGRDVKVDFKDDAYDPSHATFVCQQMVQQTKVFMLIGGGGTDQIVACAKYASSVGVPYAAEGVTEQGLSGLAGYFALSETYPQQALPLAQYIKNVLGKTKVTMLRANTANFDDAHSAFTKAARDVGLSLVGDFTINKAASNDDANTAAQQIADSKAEVVYPLMAPSIFINVVADADSKQYHPYWAGVGLTLGLNIVGQAVCSATKSNYHASFFSPFPGVDKADSVDPNFNKAYAKYNNNQPSDDIGFVLWGAEKLLAKMLAAPGRALNRKAFVDSVLATRVFDTGVFPKVDYGASRFGSTAFHVLKANCLNAAAPYETESMNKSGF